MCIAPAGGGPRLVDTLLKWYMCIVVDVGGGPRLPSTLLEEKYEYNPSQMESQVAK